MVKYIGSKRALIPVLLEAVGGLGGGCGGGVCSVLDLFSGTSRVGHALKAAGYRVVANDHNAYAATLARCYVQADADDVSREAALLIAELNALPGRPGYFTETFCERSRYLQPKNGARVDAIREAIAAKGLDAELEAVVLTSLVEAADRVDSTTGVQMAYLKKWSPRSHNDLELRMPWVLPRAAHGKGRALCMDAREAAREVEADVVYIDPPYNQHSYLGNYHVWESLVVWDKPETFGVACKRVDVKERRSAFNSRPKFAGALREVLDAVKARAVVVSFNNEGFLSRGEMEAMLGGLWGGAARVTTIENDFKRYVGAKIGIYNPKGVKVGRVSHVENKEYVYVAVRG